MKLRDRKDVNYDVSDDSSGDGSGSVQMTGKRPREAKTRSRSPSINVIPDSEGEEDDDVFESPVKKPKRERETHRRSTRATTVTYKHRSESDSDQDSDVEVTRVSSRATRLTKSDADVTKKTEIKVYRMHRGSTSAATIKAPVRSQLRRLCKLKPVVEVDSESEAEAESDSDDVVAMAEDKPEPVAVIPDSDSDSVKVIEDSDQEGEPGAVLSVDKYGLLVDGKFPAVKAARAVEKILAVRDRAGPEPLYCIKLPGKSYRDAVSVTEGTLRKYAQMQLRCFQKKMDSMERVDGHTGVVEDGPAFDPGYLIVDRVVASEQRGRSRKYYVKWKGLQYGDCTWETEASMAGEKAAVQRFMRNSSGRTRCTNIMSGFRDGRTLRDYQTKGVAWLDRNFQLKVNCILADEMGLGKTIQSVAMLENLRSKHSLKGPFLVIAPVSTLGHWQREIESLTDMNCVVYGGSSDDRLIIQNYEFWGANSKSPKFTVLLSSFEILLRDQGIFKRIAWKYVIVDEAHRMKSRESKTTYALSCLDIRKGGLLLLTGTPVQNNTKEIFSLLSLLDPEEFDSEEAFMKKYGNIKDIEQVRELQESILKPRLLRRMKEDVEKTIPLKEETIIWVELTKEQRTYYRAIYENRIHDLMKGSLVSNMPNLRNMSMELRKMCNHPFLCDGIEEDFNSKYSSTRSLVQSSGKMVLLDKMLPMLKEGGHRVLIFSQFVIMLDILEDYLQSKNHSFERIDGKIRGSERQAAIDRYSAKDSECFIFLLSTRAGGLGITLTAADTCIIYDSDWNPQNDLQAMARCHRIGQTKDVKIYRLITKSTYEERLFECSSRKYGLDEALLGNYQDIEPEGATKNIESLLRHGAYDMMKEDGDCEAEAFNAENIDNILQKRTQKRTIGGRGNNTFSVATFVSVEDLNHGNAAANTEIDDMDAEEFWKKMLPEAAVRQADESAKKLGRRSRRGEVKYVLDSEGDEEATSGSDETGEDEKPQDLIEWTQAEVKRLEGAIATFGNLPAEKLAEHARLSEKSLEEVEQVGEALVKLCQHLHEAKKEESESRERPPIPSCAEEALSSPGLTHRLQKNAARYLRIIHEREVIAKAMTSNALSINLPRGKLPEWWGEAEDVSLIRGVHQYGHKKYSKIREDPILCFASRTFGSNESDAAEEGKPSEKWPSDFVLSGRVKKIVKALSADAKQTGQAEKPEEQPAAGECPGLKLSSLRKNKRIVSGKPDEARQRSKRMKTLPSEPAAETHPVFEDRAEQQEAKNVAKRHDQAQGARPAPSPAEMNKENRVPKSQKRKDMSEKQNTLHGYFSPRLRAQQQQQQ